MRRFAALFVIFCVSALPAAAQQTFQVGVATGVNDPFIYRNGVLVEASSFLGESYGVSGHAAYYPDRGDSDWTALASELVNEFHVSPDVARVNSDFGFTFFVEPYSTQTTAGRGAFGAYSGLSMVRTTDDLEALQQVGDSTAMATQIQSHVAGIFGFYASVYLGDSPIGLRVRSHRVSYVETIASYTLENKAEIFAGFELSVVLGEGGLPTTSEPSYGGAR